MREITVQSFAEKVLEVIEAETNRVAAASRQCAAAGHQDEAARWDAATHAVVRVRKEVEALAEEQRIRPPED
ncbi:hypothetical protein [Mycobacteroides abscessus]|uniref:hypothetical protein n=1 Tax=Mycobacteroides abscessus TaxID=36809 RepID=UPI0012FFFD16|nr:hypothetical protein [Mycobacteroides abscessus]